MEISGKALVRRWGWRAVGLAVTGIGLYLVVPSLLTMFGAWPQLADVAVHWFVVLAVLEICSFAALWWLARIALAPAPCDAPMADGHVEVVPHLSWGTTATAQLAGNAASKVVPGGAATGGVVQAKVLISAGQPAATVASGLTAVSLLGTAVLLLLPVLTIPALIIGPPPAKQLQLGLVVSVILAAAIVAVGVTALTWPRVVAVIGRGIGRTVHLVRASVTPEGLADTLLAAAGPDRCRVRRALVASYVRSGGEPHVRLRRPRRGVGGVRGTRPPGGGPAGLCRRDRRSRSSRSPPVESGSSTPA